MPGKNYYFKSSNKINGDKQHNLGNNIEVRDKEKALEHYQTALTLYQKQWDLLKTIESTQSDDLEKAGFYSGLFSASVDIIQAHCMIIQQNIAIDNKNLNSTIEHLNAMPMLIDTMKTSNEQIKRLQQNSKPKDKINKSKEYQSIYYNLGATYEKVSDAYCDLDNTAMAISWMEAAIQYKLLASKTIHTANHLGYLYLLECEYKESGDLKYLQKMDAHIKAHPIEEGLSPINTLEFISYSLEIALVFYPEKVAFLISQGKEAINTLKQDPSFDDDEEPLVHDFNELCYLSSYEEDDLNAANIMLDFSIGEKRPRSAETVLAQMSTDSTLTFFSPHKRQRTDANKTADNVACDSSKATVSVYHT